MGCGKKGLSAAAKEPVRFCRGARQHRQMLRRAPDPKSVGKTDFVAQERPVSGPLSPPVSKLALTTGDIRRRSKPQKFPGDPTDQPKRWSRHYRREYEFYAGWRCQSPKGVVATYMHTTRRLSNMGKIGVLVGLDRPRSPDKLAALGKRLAMHVAAANPQSVTIDAVDPAQLERERAVLADQAHASGKPEEIIGKMVEGALAEYYEDVVLLEQLYAIDGESQVNGDREGRQGTRRADQDYRFYRMALGEAHQEEGFRRKSPLQQLSA